MNTLNDKNLDKDTKDKKDKKNTKEMQDTIKQNYDFLMNGDASEIKEHGLPLKRDLREDESYQRMNRAGAKPNKNYRRGADTAFMEFTQNPTIFSYSPYGPMKNKPTVYPSVQNEAEQTDEAVPQATVPSYRPPVQTDWQPASQPIPVDYGSIHPIHTTAVNAQTREPERPDYTKVRPSAKRDENTIDVVQVRDNIYKQQVQEDKKNPVDFSLSYENKQKKVENPGDFTLSIHAKVFIAIIATMVLLVFTVIMINSAFLNSLDVELEALRTTLDSLSTQAAQVSSDIEKAVSDETILSYAQSVGMILG